MSARELITRRHFLGRGGLGLGSLALASLTGRMPLRRDAVPRVKNVIYLHMAGGPSQLDLFEHKPELKALHGQPCPASYIENERFAFIKGHPELLGSPYRFRRHGESGMWVSELLPHLARRVDELAFVRSMHTDEINHAPAQMLLHTGSPRFGRASMGSWVSYGLGSENRNLPAFVVLISGGKYPSAGKSVWGSGFLPTEHQGVELRSDGNRVLYLDNPPDVDRAARRRQLDALRDLNERHFESVGDPETSARIAQYELAFRMQMAIPEVTDLSRETESTLAMYGANPGEASFASNCLLARRLIENDVRFVQLYDWGWDSHGTGPGDDIVHQLPRKCWQTDRAVAALLVDLRQRGLLDETLVVWGGEFGRTAMNEKRDGSTYLGRDHHPHCFTIWLAGGGVKAGTILGATDDLGYRITERPVHVHDLQATILHLLGIEHERLVYPFQGREFRLTDVAGHVVPEILA